MPTAELTEEDFEGNEIDILTLLLKSGLVPSKSEARRAVQHLLHGQAVQNAGV